MFGRDLFEQLSEKISSDHDAIFSSLTFTRFFWGNTNRKYVRRPRGGGMEKTHLLFVRCSAGILITSDISEQHYIPGSADFGGLTF